jgi:hypothetical protein
MENSIKNSIMLKATKTLNKIKILIYLQYVLSLKNYFQSLMTISLNIKSIKLVRNLENTFNNLKTINDLKTFNKMLNLFLKQQEYLVKELKNNFKN